MSTIQSTLIIRNTIVRKLENTWLHFIKAIYAKLKRIGTHLNPTTLYFFWYFVFIVLKAVTTGLTWVAVWKLLKLKCIAQLCFCKSAISKLVPCTTCSMVPVWSFSSYYLYTNTNNCFICIHNNAWSLSSSCLS